MDLYLEAQGLTLGSSPAKGVYHCFPGGGHCRCGTDLNVCRKAWQERGFKEVRHGQLPKPLATKISSDPKYLVVLAGVARIGGLLGHDTKILAADVKAAVVARMATYRQQQPPPRAAPKVGGAVDEGHSGTAVVKVCSAESTSQAAGPGACGENALAMWSGTVGAAPRLDGTLDFTEEDEPLGAAPVGEVCAREELGAQSGGGGLSLWCRGRGGRVAPAALTKLTCFDRECALDALVNDADSRPLPMPPGTRRVPASGLGDRFTIREFANSRIYEFILGSLKN